MVSARSLDSGRSADLKGRVAIVTGAGSVGPGIGNGRAAVLLLARKGALVCAADISLEAAQVTASMAGAEGGTTMPVDADVATPEGAASVVAATAGAFGRIDILVNNVGIVGARGTAADVDPDAWDEVMRINVKSMMLMLKYSLPHLEAAGGGAVVNISSTAGISGGHPSLAYPTSKGAVINMTRAMAYHHARAGIRVNCVAPGLVFTPRVELRGLSDEAREARRLESPLQTPGTAWDVAEAVGYLVSDAARWVTGITLPVDAGLTASRPSVGAH